MAVINITNKTATKILTECVHLPDVDPSTVIQVDASEDNEKFTLTESPDSLKPGTKVVNRPQSPFIIG